MKRIFRNAALVLLALILLTSQAAAQVAKDEVVYALLSAEGEVRNIYVVNGFEAADQSAVSDYGAYSETQPLTQAESFSYQEGEAAFTMAPGRFFYQGTPEGKQLPWDIAITYTLDGKEAAPEALSGAEGKLGIAFSLKPSAEGAAISRSLAMTVTVTLDGKRALNIQADKGTLAYAGGNVTVSYVILPGQEAAYEITADVKDFAMAGMQFAAVRMGVDKAMYQNIAAKALEGTPFVQAAGGMMEQFLAGMEGQPTASFMDSRNAVRTLQFVLLSEEIPVKKPVVTPAPQAETTDTVWQRLLSLFGG
ncbi:MAG: hypothetical protein ACOX6O_09400 [Christensenellales bacterium]|jgi:hypothetical protein